VSGVNGVLTEFSERNLLLQLLLGVVSHTDRLIQLVPPVADATSPTHPQDVDPFVAALLGMVSLRARLFEIASETTGQTGVDASRAFPAKRDTGPDAAHVFARVPGLLR
jgi:hypothetical protein